MQLDIEIDLGGGFEGGSQTQRRPPSAQPYFLFSLHEQDWLHEIGKLLGLTDVQLGDPCLWTLPSSLLPTMRPPCVSCYCWIWPCARRCCATRNAASRWLRLPDEVGADVYLTFSTETALTDPIELRKVYHALYTLLRKIAPLPHATT